MPSLFDHVRVGSMTLANRIVMAPLTRNRSPENIPNAVNAAYYKQRASAGLIIAEATPISQQGQGYADVPGLYEAQQLAGWRKVTDAVHEAGGKIVVQMWHVGRISHTSLQPHGGQPVAPSAIIAKSKTYLIDENGTGAFAPTSQPRALEKGEIAAIVADYARAAKAAIEVAGFDGVEMHAANGYLIDQFLRSNSNHRSDDYGGSIENRARFLLEVVAAVTKEIGGDKVGIRLSPVTPANDAFDPEPQPLFDYVAQKLGASGLAFIHVIEGATGGDREYQQGDTPFDYARLRQAYRDGGGTGAWMLNNGYTKALAEEAIETGKADLIAFGRPFIANPDLVERFKQDAALNALNTQKLYGAGEEGYTDYPTLAG